MHLSQWWLSSGWLIPVNFQLLELLEKCIQDISDAFAQGKD